ncbi:MAG TPA: hypothetical protein DDW54_03045 [Clostridiales bacterium]|nr:hypothetical protein [Clostridiales bacterium]
MYFFYIRHGDPIYDPDSITEYGKTQAEALSKRFAEIGLDKIYSSTSNRAVMTATPTAEKLGLTIERLDFAHEKYAGQDFGKVRDGKGTWCFFDPETVEKFKSAEIFAKGFEWYKDDFFKGERYGGGIERVRKETVKLIESFGYIYDYEKRSYKSIKPQYKRVALFAHGGFGNAFLSCLLEIPYPLFTTRFAHLSTTGVCVIEIADEGENVVPLLLQYGNDSHLYKENIDRKFNGKEVF